MPELTLFDQLPEVAQRDFGRFKSNNYPSPDYPPPDRYHNTTGLSGEELFAREMRVESQGRKILAYFRQHPGESFTPHEIRRILGYGPFQLQSVRRSLTNLTQCTEHYLYMTGEKRIEEMGDPNNCWALNTKVPQTGFSLTLPEKAKKF
jgi:hypothetical protein